MDPPRLALPGNLARSLRHLDDAQSEELLRTATAEARRIAGFYAHEGLERPIAARSLRRDLATVEIDCGIVDRDYQIECIETLSAEVSRGRRKLLLEMATGTVKTRTAAAFVTPGGSPPTPRSARAGVSPCAAAAVRRDRPAREIGGHLRRLNGWKIERDKLSAAMAALTFAQRKCARARISARSQQRTSWSPMHRGSVRNGTG